MTNQASEDGLRNIISLKMAEAYRVDECGYPNDAEERAYVASGEADREYQDMLIKRTLSLIRTEKLKLLAEVRERVIGVRESKANLEPYGDRYSTVHDRNTLRGEQNSALTKLEAEL
jgi:hypothetical protein